MYHRLCVGLYSLYSQHNHPSSNFTNFIPCSLQIASVCTFHLLNGGTNVVDLDKLQLVRILSSCVYLVNNLWSTCINPCPALLIHSGNVGIPQLST